MFTQADRARLETELPKRVAQNIPGFEIRFKTESKLQRFLGAVLFFVPAYMTRYSTTMFGKLYLPSRGYAAQPTFSIGWNLSHEYVHLWDDKVDPLFKVKYLFPQILAFGAFGAFWNLWFLLFLVALLPWPAYWRMKFEMRGYSGNLALATLAPRFESESKDVGEWVVDIMTGPSYYWMWPFKRDIESRVKKAIEEAKNGELYKGPESHPYRLVKEILEGK